MAEAKRLADAGLGGSPADLLARVAELEGRVRQAEQRRRALLHIMGDLHDSNKRLGEQRKAMLHILKDSHESNLRLEASRKAMIHIMGDLRETTAEMERREHELRQKQEQLVQAGKLATLGELTTGVAHELNNPLNNIGLFVGNAVDLIELAVTEKGQIVRELRHAVRQVIERALSLMGEQLRLREIAVTVDLGAEESVVVGNPIQLEQVFINLLTNARDAVADSPRKAIRISGAVSTNEVEVALADTGPGIPPGLERRIFDPFFTTKEVGKGTGLGLSITYGIIKEHGGTITVANPPGEGATFLIRLPIASD